MKVLTNAQEEFCLATERYKLFLSFNDSPSSYHVVQTYIPSTIYLTVSWLALFVPPQSIAERLAMAMTIMLTLTAMFASERQVGAACNG